MRVLELGGAWELAPIPCAGVRADQAQKWYAMDVPSHWQQHEELRDYAGYMLYRKHFSFKAKKDERYQLVLPGVFYWSTVFFNGRRLGNSEGYFVPQRYEVTELLAEDNELLVEVHCPNEKNRSNKRMIAGVFSHWDCLDPTTNPGGIWLAPELHATGSAGIDSCLFHTDELDKEGATVSIKVEITAREATTQKCVIELQPANFEGEGYSFERDLELDAGRNKLVFQHHLARPALWWTHDRGKPNLYRLTLTLRDGRRVTDAFEDEVGIRTVRFHDWICHLNNQRLYLKGNNQPPTDTRIAKVTYEDCARDIELYKRCHMNIIRVHAHVDHPQFYRAADRLGILIWQDFPLQWSYAREVLPVAERMIREMVRLLYNRPSIAMWCCHNEPIYLLDTSGTGWVDKYRTLISLFFWSWDRNVMDPVLQRAVEETDRTRFCNRCSGEVALPWQSGGDTHFYFGWYREQGKSYWGFDRVVYRRSPKNLRFVTEFGAQSFPNLKSSEKFMDPDIRRIDWAELHRRHSLQIELMDHWVGLQQPDLATLIEKSQRYQTALNRFHVDRIRRLKYQPNGGIVPFMFVDPNPAIQWSVVDYWREPKASYHALRDAMRPVYPFVVFDRERRRPGGTPVKMEVYLVNDTLDDLGEVTLNLTVDDEAGNLVAEHRAKAPVGPDSTAVHFLTVRESPDATGVYRVTLRMDHAGDRFDNVYTFRVE